MDKIAKALSRLSKKERDLVKIILSKIIRGDFKNFNLKKLVGYENIFRVKKGKLRIICIIEESKPIQILTIERRTETTYRKY